MGDKGEGESSKRKGGEDAVDECGREGGREVSPDLAMECALGASRLYLINLPTALASTLRI